MIKDIFHMARSASRHEYASRNVYAALLRFFRFQAASRLVGQPILMPFVGDTRLFMKHGLRGANLNYYFGLAEFRDMAFCLHYLRPHDLFIDVGANIGSYSVLASGAAGARTIAFEPVPSTAAQFRLNAAVNGLLDLIDLRTVAVSNYVGMTPFSTSFDTNNSILPKMTVSETLEVPVTTLNDAVSERPQLIKIDTEGYDSECIAGATKFIESSAPLAMLVEFGRSASGSSTEHILAWLRANDLELLDYDPWTRSLLPTNLSARRTNNFLLVRDVEDARRRVVSAQKYEFGRNERI